MNDMMGSHRLADLAHAIAGAEAVSFDVFDTLFVRPLCDPEDAFDILGHRFGIPDFRTRRRAAQAEAFRRMQQAQRAEITLEEIYESFGPLPVPAAEIRQAEHDLELVLTQPNPEMVEMFRLALSQGKRVVITSDMYLRQAFFDTLLRQHGVEAVPLFISADRNATKRDHGALFDIVAQEIGVPHGKILHIGDNVLSDIRRADEKGLQTYHYTEARKPPRKVGESPTASLTRGLVRVHGREVPQGTLEELGFMRVGPAAVGFLDWVIEEARRDRIDHVLFVSRDGYVLQQLAEARAARGATEMPPSSYLLGSRVAFALAAMDERNFAEHLPFLAAGSHGLAPAEVLERLGVTPPAAHVMAQLGLGADETVREDRPAKLLELLNAWRWEILKVSRRNRRGLFRHLIDLGLRPGQRVAMVDIGWNGTTQQAFEAALQGLMPLETHGYYLCLTDSADCQRRRKAMRMKALVGSGTVPPEQLAAIYANRVGIEFFFSAPHHAVIGYDPGPEGVAPVEDPGRADPGDILGMSPQVLRGVLAFERHFASARQELALPPDPLGCAAALLDFAADGSWAREPALAEVRNFDAWGSSRNRTMRLTDYATQA